MIKQDLVKNGKYILGIALLLIVFGYVMANNGEKPSESNNTSPLPTYTTAVLSGENGTEATVSTKPGTYVAYDEASFLKTAGSKILFFHAPWCPQCRALEASINSGTIPTGVTISKVDYDSHQALRKKYGVTIQTTLVLLDDEGKLIKRYVAYDEPTLASVVKNLLP